MINGIFMFLALLFQEQYYVSHIHGVVLYGSKADTLRIGRPVTEADSLIFTSSTDYVSLLSPSAGRMRVTRNSFRKGKGPNEFILMIGKNLVPDNKAVIMAGRSGMIFNNNVELQRYFKQFLVRDAAPLLILDSLELRLDPAGYRNIDRNFFYASYNYHGVTINKKLRFKTGANNLWLVFDLSFFSVDGKPIDPGKVSGIELFYLDVASKQAENFGPININAVSSGKLRPEVETIYQFLNASLPEEPAKADKILYQIQIHIGAHYGFTDITKIKSLLQIT